MKKLNAHGEVEVRHKLWGKWFEFTFHFEAKWLPEHYQTEEIVFTKVEDFEDDSILEDLKQEPFWLILEKKASDKVEIYVYDYREDWEIDNSDFEYDRKKDMMM